MKNVPTDEPIYLTAEGLENLKKKLKRLEEALPGYSTEVARTAAYGDRSDNAEYKEAKQLQRRTQAQIFYIKEDIKRVVIISDKPNTSGKIQLGNTVIVKTEDGAQKTFRIVGPRETNPSEGKVSFESPLGTALMNHAKGDSVTIALPSGTQKYTILEIS